MSADTSPSPLERWALRLSRVGLLVIVVVTFVTSFDAVAAVAVARGAVNPRLAWALPLAVDGMIVVGSAIGWAESLRGERWHPFPVILVAVAGGLSVAANVAHADGGGWLARSLAAVPPVFLLAAVELGAWQIRRGVHRNASGAVQTAISPVESDVHLNSDMQEADVQPVQEPAVVHVQAGDLHAAARAWLHDNPGCTLEDATRADIAAIAQVSPSTASRKWDLVVHAVEQSANGARV